MYGLNLRRRLHYWCRCWIIWLLISLPIIIVLINWLVWINLLTSNLILIDLTIWNFIMLALIIKFIISSARSVCSIKWKFLLVKHDQFSFKCSILVFNATKFRSTNRCSSVKFNRFRIDCAAAFLSSKVIFSLSDMRLFTTNSKSQVN